MSVSLEVTPGLEASDGFSGYCLLGAEGEVRTTPRALRSFFEGRKLRVVLEAGPHS